MRAVRGFLPVAAAIFSGLACDSTRPDFCREASVAIVPASLSVPAGGRVVLLAQVHSDGAEVSCGVRWTARSESGRIDEAGRFTASTRVGDYPDAVTASVGGASASARVTIVPGEGALLRIVPETVSVVANGRVPLSLVLEDAWGNRIPVAASWSAAATAGSVSADGVLAAGTRAGLFADSLQASAQGLTARASIRVLPGPPHAVQVTPATARLVAGDSVQLTATVEDAWGNPIALSPAWSVDSGGSVSATGMYHATRAGAHRVSASAQDSLRGSADVTVSSGALARLSIRPDPLVTSVYDSAQANVEALDAFGNPVAVTPVWHLAPEAGTLVAPGYVKAGRTTGTFAGALTATAGTSTATAAVRVIGGSAKVMRITPASAEITIGDSLQFTVVAQDAWGNTTTTALTWAVEGTGGVSASGMYRATGVGTDQVVVSAGPDLRSVAEVTVLPAIARLVIEPDTLVTLPRDSVSARVRATDAAGNEVPVTAKWHLAPEAGTLVGPGYVRGTRKAGMYVGALTATVGTFTARASVRVYPADAWSVEVTPQNPTVVAGESVQFHATPVDSFGNVTANRLGWWSVSRDQIPYDLNKGYVDSTGRFFGRLAGVRGVEVVFRRWDDTYATGSATVTVVPGPVTKLNVFPSSSQWVACLCCTIIDRDTCQKPVQYSATGEDAYGNKGLELNPAPTWTLDSGKGTLSATGLYMPASECRRTDTIRATSGSATGTANLYVIDPNITGVSIRPSIDTLFVGESKPYLEVTQYCDHEATAERTYTAPMTPGLYSFEWFAGPFRIAYAYRRVLARP